MNQNNYRQTQKNGKWLTAFLDENLTAWELKDLARDAVAILGLDYQIKDNDPTFLVLEQLENDNPGQRLLQAINSSMPDRINQADSLRGEIEKHEHDFEQQIKKIIRQSRQTDKDLEFVMEQFGSILKPLLKQHYAQDVPKPPTESIDTDILYRNVYDIEYYRRAVVKNLKVFLEHPNAPWEYLVHNRVIEQTSCNYFPNIIEAYSLLAEKIITIKPMETGKKSPVKSDHRSLAAAHKLKKIFTFTSSEAETTLPWGTAIARLFFDFLFHGGRDYYGFCERCDKFFVIQRKGRKKYCGDSCRALASRERTDRNPANAYPQLNEIAEK